MSTTTATIWPRPIRVIGLSGEYESGKSLFGLTIDPTPGKTRVYDHEHSTEPYDGGLSFDRIDVPAEMLKIYPKGYRPQHTYLWWRDHIKTITPGKYSVIGLDPVSEIESGLTDWVMANPSYFGRTSTQYQKFQSLMWVDMKELWKSLLADLASRCQTFYFTAHMKNIWLNEKPTGKRTPKGKDTLMELASLYLILDRRANQKGIKPEKPSAVVVKTRLTHILREDDGSVTVKPALPPRLEVCTPDAIRAYMLNPPDYSKLKPGERAIPEEVTDDERAAIRLETATAEAEAERTKLALLERREEIERIKAEKAKAKADAEALEKATKLAAEGMAKVPATMTANGTSHPPAAAQVDAPPGTTGRLATEKGSISRRQAGKVVELRSQLFQKLGIDLADEAAFKAAWGPALKKRGVASAAELSEAQADELINSLVAKITAIEMGETLASAGEKS